MPQDTGFQIERLQVVPCAMGAKKSIPSNITKKFQNIPNSIHSQTINRTKIFSDTQSLKKISTYAPFSRKLLKNGQQNKKVNQEGGRPQIRIQGKSNPQANDKERLPRS